MCIPRAPTSSCAKARDYEDDVLGCNRSNMQRLEESECKGSETPPALAPTLESLYNDSDDATTGRRKIRRYGSHHTFLWHDHVDKAQSSSHATSN